VVWRRLLLTALLASSTLLAATGSELPCSSDRQLAGTCSVKLNTDIAANDARLDALYEELNASPTRAEAPQPDPVDRSPMFYEGSPDGNLTRPTAPVDDFCSPVDPADCRMSAAEPEPPPAGEPAVTMRDIASFRPAEPGNGMEPGGWAVVGLPANFVAESSVQTLTGTLLGRPAEVRFHPVAYRWTHSDGAVVQTSTPGATWEALGQPEFTATATSHIYATSGEYTVDVAVVFVAEYRFDGSVWRWIDGTLSVPGAPQSVLVGEFDTVLVTGDCRVAPDGPGC
jgi:hypothetical protein